MSRRPPLLLLHCVLLVAACRNFVAPDGADAGQALSSVDAAPPGCGLDGDSDSARGILWLANHADATELRAAPPLGAGLDVASAQAIVGAQPFAGIAALDTIHEVTQDTCDRLEALACHRLGRCEEALDLVTWNLKTFPLSSDTSSEVSLALDEMGADIIGLQEIESSSSFYNMRDAMLSYDGFVGRKGFATRVAILYRPERYEVIGIDDLFEDDSYAFPRSPLAVTFALRGQAATAHFTVVVLHLKAMSDDESVSRRRLAMDRLNEWIGAQPVQSIFLIGDFNDRITDPPEDDVFSVLRSGDYRFLTDEIAQSGGYSYIRYGSLIDHTVATAAGARVLPMRGAEAMPMEDSIYQYQERVSDHRPVVTHHLPILPGIDSRLSALPW